MQYDNLLLKINLKHLVQMQLMIYYYFDHRGLFIKLIKKIIGQQNLQMVLQEGCKNAEKYGEKTIKKPLMRHHKKRKVNQTTV